MHAIQDTYDKATEPDEMNNSHMAGLLASQSSKYKEDPKCYAISDRQTINSGVTSHDKSQHAIWKLL